MSTLRGPSQLADLQGALCVPPITLHVASTAGLAIVAAFLQSLRFFLTWRFCFCFPSSPQPLFFLGWLLNGGSALPPTTATTAAVRWQGALLLLVAGHVSHGRHLPSTRGRHYSSEHTPRLGFWSLLLVAGHAPHRRYLPSTCGRHCS